MSPREEFEKLLRALHVLQSTGDGESGEADTLRDAMDAPWRAMSEADQTEMRKLSAALYEAPL